MSSVVEERESPRVLVHSARIASVEALIRALQSDDISITAVHEPGELPDCDGLQPAAPVLLTVILPQVGTPQRWFEALTALNPIPPPVLVSGDAERRSRSERDSLTHWQSLGASVLSGARGLEQVVVVLRLMCEMVRRERRRRLDVAAVDASLTALDDAIRNASRQVRSVLYGESESGGLLFPDALLVFEIERLKRMREERDRLFPNPLFADPGWDLLLDLALQQLSGKDSYISGLAVGAGVPLTTALRHLQLLERMGLAVRVDDPMDRRRVRVLLTEEGMNRVRRYLQLSARAHRLSTDPGFDQQPT